MTRRWYRNSATLLLWHFFDAHTMVNKFNNFTITYPEWQDDDIEIPEIYYCGIFLMLIPWLTNSTTLLLLPLITRRWYRNSATLLLWHFFDAHTMVNKFNNFTITYPEWQDVDIEIPQLYYCGIFLMLIPWLTNSTTLLLLTLNDKTMI